MKVVLELLKLLMNDWTEEITIFGLIILGGMTAAQKPEIALAVATGLIGYLKRAKS